MDEEILNEGKQIHRGSDHRDPASGRRRCADGRVVPRAYASFYKWRAKYGGMDASLISQMKAMEDGNRRLKRMYADISMQADLLREGLSKNVWSAPRLQGCRAWPSGLRKCIRPLISEPLLAARP